MYNCPVDWTHTLSKFYSNPISAPMFWPKKKLAHLLALRLIKFHLILGIPFAMSRMSVRICCSSQSIPIFWPLQCIDDNICVRLYDDIVPSLVYHQLYRMQDYICLHMFRVEVLARCAPASYNIAFPIPGYHSRSFLPRCGFSNSITVYFYRPCSGFFHRVVGVGCGLSALGAVLPALQHFSVSLIASFMAFSGFGLSPLCTAQHRSFHISQARFSLCSLCFSPVARSVASILCIVLSHSSLSSSVNSSH